MSGNPNEFYSQEEKEAMADELQDRESLPGHYAVDDGYCSCGVLCETGTRFRETLMTPNPTFRAAREAADAFDDSMPLADRARLASLISERFRKLISAAERIDKGYIGDDDRASLREALKEVL